MAPTKQIQELLKIFGDEAKARQRRREEDDFRVKKQREEKLSDLEAKLKADLAAERKKELAAFARADRKIRTDRHTEDGKILDAFTDKLSKTIIDALTPAGLRSATPEAPGAVGEATDHASGSKLQTPTQDSGQFSVITPMSETPPAGELSFAERRRRNQEINLGIMASISPLQMSRKSKKIKASKSEGELVSNPEHDALHGVSISEVGSHDMIVEFPLFSQQFYVLKCTICQTSFATVGAMDLHAHHYGHGIIEKKGNEEYIVSKFGSRVIDATVQWVQARQGKMIEEFKDVGNSAKAKLDADQLGSYGSAITTGDHSDPTADIKVQPKNVGFVKEGLYEADRLEAGNAPGGESEDFEEITLEKFVLSQKQRRHFWAELTSE